MKCILFDLDGTLVTTGGAGIRALEKAFLILFQIPNSMKNIDPSGKTDPAIIREIFLDCLGRDPAPEEMRSVQDTYLSLLGDECDRAEDYRIMSGIPGLLSQLLREDITVGLGTGNLERGARIKLKRAGLNHFLPFGGFGSDHEDRAELLKIGRKRAQEFAGHEFYPENIFVVGDTERDIYAARKAQFKVIAVGTGQTSSEILKQHMPDHFLPNFENEDRFLEIICGN